MAIDASFESFYRTQNLPSFKPVQLFKSRLGNKVLINDKSVYCNSVHFLHDRLLY